MYSIIEYKEEFKDFYIKSFEEDDIDGLISLFERNFKKTMGPTESKNHFIWEYLNNPLNIVAILIAKNDRDYMAQYALLPKKFSIFNKEYLCCLSLDTVTDVKYRGRGLFPLLANRLYALVKERGFYFTYGFPNKNSADGFFNKLKWIEIKGIGIMVKPVYLKNADYSRVPKVGSKYLVRLMYKSFARLNNLLFKRGMDPSLSFIEYEKYDSIFDGIWSNFDNKEYVISVRDGEYIKWRYFDKPENNYRKFIVINGDNVAGYFVTSEIEKFGIKILFIIDFLLIEKKYLYDILAYVEKIAKESGCIMISSIVPISFRRIFLLSGFLPLPGVMFPQDLYFGLLPHNINDEGMVKKVTDFKNWYLSWSDIDVV